MGINSDTDNSDLKRQLEEKNKLIEQKTLKIEELKNSIKSIKSDNLVKNQLEEKNIIIEQLKLKIDELQNRIKINDDTIKNFNITIKNNNKIIEDYKKAIDQKNSELKRLKEQNGSNANSSSNLSSNMVNINDIITVLFISEDKKVNFPIPCVKNNTFAEVEEKLYKQYPELRETNNNFTSGGIQVLRFKTIAENKIGFGLPVILSVP